MPPSSWPGRSGQAGGCYFAPSSAITCPRLWWLKYFPRGYEVDASMYQPLDEVIATFAPAGWRVASFGTVTEPSCGTRRDMLERLQLRTLSTFAYLTPGELDAGFRRQNRPSPPIRARPCPTITRPY